MTELPRPEAPHAAQSSSETKRFGRRVARLVIDEETALELVHDASGLDNESADVVILRYPNKTVELFGTLMSLTNYVPLFADCLIYWERSLRPYTLTAMNSPSLSVRDASEDEMVNAVRSIFDEYPNHYAANPLLDRTAALEGYVEWIGDLVASRNAKCIVLLDSNRRIAGFSAIDFAPVVADVKLAGISPNHRRKGLYFDLMIASMNLVSSRERDRIAISTQAHNVSVMATWARLGWTPERATTTIHLVRRGLLGTATS